jgi:hypothetical protein
MNEKQNHLRQRLSETKDARQASNAEQTQEFSTVEDLIRFDATSVEPPESLARRVNESAAAEPPTKDPWWRRIWTRS